MLFSCAGILEGCVWNLLASELKVDECLLVFWVVWWWQGVGGVASISHHSRPGLQMAKGTRTRRGCRRKDGCSAARRSRIIYQYVDFVWPVIPPPPPTPSGIGARHLSPQVSFILRRFGPPLVTDEQKKNDRQMNKGADAVWGPETERAKETQTIRSQELYYAPICLHHIWR